jgi:hypothetical protein
MRLDKKSAWMTAEAQKRAEHEPKQVAKNELAKLLVTETWFKLI